MPNEEKTISTEATLPVVPNGNGCRQGGCCCEQTPKVKLAVLLVDDDPDYLEMLADAIKRSGKVDVYTAQGPEHALAIVQQRDIAMVVCDHFLTKGMTGTGMLEMAMKIRPAAVRVLITAKPSLNVAVGGVNRAKIQAFIFKGGKPKFVVKQILQELPGVAA